MDKLRRSNDAHERLAKKHMLDAVAYAIVNHDDASARRPKKLGMYHHNVKARQIELNRILSFPERKEIFKRS